MGTKVSVGSSCYNLAGDIKHRGNYLKNVVIHSALSAASTGMGKDITDAYLNSPAQKLLRYDRWAKRSGYNATVGNQPAVLETHPELSHSDYDTVIPPPAGISRELRAVRYESNSYQLMAEQYLRKHDPSKLELGYEVDAQRADPPSMALTGDLVIIFPDTTTVVFTPSLPLTTSNRLVVFEYAERPEPYPINSSDGPFATLVEAELPDLVSYTGGYSSPITESVSWENTETTVITYSDSTPSTTSSVILDSGTTAINTKSGTFTKEIEAYQISPVTLDRTTTLEIEYSYKVVSEETESTNTEDMGGGVTKTTTVTTISQTVVPEYRYTASHVDMAYEAWSDEYIDIYEIGTDETKDTIVLGSQATDQVYFPFMPLRMNNVPVNQASYPDQYAWNRKASRKLFGGKNKYDQLLKNIANSPSVGDIDYAYVMQGVAAGSQETGCVEYVYAFVKDLFQHFEIDPNTAPTAAGIVGALNARIAARENQPATGYRRQAFERLVLPPPCIWRTSTWGLDLMIQVNGGRRTVGSGYNPRSKGKVGKCWIYQKDTLQVDNVFLDQLAVLQIGKQLTPTSWEEIEVYTFDWINTIHWGRAVTKNMATALAHSNPEEYGMILPISKAALLSVSTVPRAQLALGSSYILINYYVVKKTKWYKKLLGLLIAIAVFVVFPPSGGIFGSSAAVGSSLGLSGTVGFYVGAGVNALAAAVISGLVVNAAISILGPKLGGILGAILSGMTLNFVSGAGFSLGGGGNLLQHFSKADNLIKLTMQAIDAYSAHITAKAQDLLQSANQVMLDYKAKSAALDKKYLETFGYQDIDPSVITDALRNSAESMEQYLTRTLMTGDMIAQHTLDIIEQFPKYQLQLSLSGGIHA